jgi:hypothetical protein
MRPRFIKERSAARKAREARARVLSGSVERHVAYLERLVSSKLSVSIPAGEPLIPVPAIQNALAAVRRLAEARRFLAAVRALTEATELVERNLPAQRHRDALARAAGAAGAALAAATAAATARARRASPIGNQEKRRRKAERAEDYVQRARVLRKTSPYLSLNSVVVKLMAQDVEDEEQSPRGKTQIRTYLTDAGLT